MPLKRHVPEALHDNHQQAAGVRIGDLAASWECAMRMLAKTQSNATEPTLFDADAVCHSARHLGAATDEPAALARQVLPLAFAGGDAAALLPATLHRLLRQRTGLLVWAETAPRFWQLARRVALHMADAVLVGDEAAEAAVIRAGKPARASFNVPGPYAIDDFLHHPAGRDVAAAFRLVVCGGLAPDGDSLHILNTAASWAESNPCRTLELCWVGDGDLRGVLAAQSLPDNIVQHFAGAQDLAGTQAAFLRSGVLVAGTPARAELAGRGELLAQAMASGLVVLFDRDCPVAGRLLRHGLTGFGYQTSRQEGLLDTLGDVMDTPAGMLDPMRNAARMRVLPMNRQGFEERLGRAVESVLRDAAQGGRSQGRFLTPPALQAR